MQITTTTMVELDEQEVEQFEEEYWPTDERNEIPYFSERLAGPFLVDLESVSFETREWLEKYNEGWEGFLLWFESGEDHERARRLCEYPDRVSVTLFRTHALVYFRTGYLEAMIRTMFIPPPTPPAKENHHHD